jgi:hypothetical protein
MTPSAPYSAALERRLALVDFALAVTAPIFPPTCLRRAVTRYYYLRRAGVAVGLVFGIGAPDGASAGHCWLIRDNVPFLEPRDPRSLFQEMYRIEPAMG